ncbi:MAG: S1 family peptidase [Anaerolineae bacterium]|nr:S1 family peptidase [Anaerolineae bacterium]
MGVDIRTAVAAKTVIWSRQATHILYDPNITMIDFGHPEIDGQVDEDSVAIRFHVRQKLPEFAIEAAVARGVTRDELPKTLGGFQTDVQEHQYHLDLWPWGASPAAPVIRRNSRTDPLRGGISVSDYLRYTYGTLGGIVLDRSSRAPMVLSNWHVLAAGWHANPQHKVFQPGRFDGGREVDAIAMFTRHGMFQHIDAAVATLTDGGRQYLNEQLGLPNGHIQGVTAPTLGMKVVKSGRASAITHGVVDSINGRITMSYSSGDYVIQPTLLIVPATDGEVVSQPGDSGSIWLEESTMRAVGLHFAGGNIPERAVAINMTAVLAALEIDLYLE